MPRLLTPRLLARRRLSLVLVAAAVLLPLPAAPAEVGVAVVVNEANPVASATRAEVAEMFLGRATSWRGGARALACDLSAASPTRKAFSQGVHGKPLWMIVAYWQQEVASGRSRPPRVCEDEAAALAFVRREPGGISYVAEGTPLGAGVKQLTVTP